MKYFILFGMLNAAFVVASEKYDINPPKDKVVALYTLNRNVLAAGGGKVQSGNYELVSTIGQSVAHVAITSGNYTLRTGFWYDNSNDIIFVNGFE